MERPSGDQPLESQAKEQAGQVVSTEDRHGGLAVSVERPKVRDGASPDATWKPETG